MTWFLGALGSTAILLKSRRWNGWGFTGEAVLLPISFIDLKVALRAWKWQEATEEEETFLLHISKEGRGKRKRSFGKR